MKSNTEIKMASGTSVGWGSLVVTSNTYLAQAGPWGSVLGLILGTVIMVVISKNYAYLIHSFPEPGGAYAYSRDVFGYDHGFLTGWFLALTYFAMLWANMVMYSRKGICIVCSGMMCILEKRFCPLRRSF